MENWFRLVSSFVIMFMAAILANYFETFSKGATCTAFCMHFTHRVVEAANHGKPVFILAVLYFICFTSATVMIGTLHSTSSVLIDVIVVYSSCDFLYYNCGYVIWKISSADISVNRNIQ